MLFLSCSRMDLYPLLRVRNHWFRDSQFRLSSEQSLLDVVDGEYELVAGLIHDDARREKCARFGQQGFRLLSILHGSGADRQVPISSDGGAASAAVGVDGFALCRPWWPLVVSSFRLGRRSHSMSCSRLSSSARGETSTGSPTWSPDPRPGCAGPTKFGPGLNLCQFLEIRRSQSGPRFETCRS